MIRHLSAAFIFLLFPWHVRGQADSIIHLPKEEHARALWAYFTRYEQDPPLKMLKLRALEQAFSDLKEKDLAFEVRLEINHELLYNTDSLSLEAKKQIGLDALERAQAEKNKVHEGECMMQLGVFSFMQGSYGPGFEWMMKGYELLSKHGWQNPYRKVQDLEGMGHAFYKFGDYESAIRFLQEAQHVVVAPFHGYPRNGLNSIALCYQNLQQYDSAIHYYQKAITLGEKENKEFFVALAKGNLGNVYFKAGKYDEALPLLVADYNGSIAANQMGSAANASLLLATIALEKGDLPKAEEYIRFSRSHLDTSRLADMVTFYGNMYTYNRKKNDLPASMAYSDSLQTYKSRLDKVLDKKVVDRARMQVQMDKYESDVKVLENARSRQILIRNGLLIILLLTGMLAITWIRRLQYKQKKETELNLLKEKGAAERLLHAQEELNLYTKAILEKNELIHTFKSELDQMQSAGMVSMDERTAAINKLTHSTLLTEDDWKTFRNLFDQVYPGFFIRLKDKLADLTPAEIRLMALTKLRVSPRDMADMLGISADSIKKSRHRLRKKINLPEDGSLDEVVDMI